jgi:hypothetical protein
MAVQRGEEPVGVIRDPAINQMISFAVSEGQMNMSRTRDPMAAEGR